MHVSTLVYFLLFLFFKEYDIALKDQLSKLWDIMKWNNLNYMYRDKAKFFDIILDKKVIKPYIYMISTM